MVNIKEEEVQSYKRTLLHYYKIVKNYGLICDCNDVYTKVQDCLNFLDRKYSCLDERHFKVIRETLDCI